MVNTVLFITNGQSRCVYLPRTSDVVLSLVHIGKWLVVILIKTHYFPILKMDTLNVYLIAWVPLYSPYIAKENVKILIQSINRLSWSADGGHISCITHV